MKKDLENLGVDLGGYVVETDLYEIYPTTMTEEGIEARDLLPVGMCSLTPGEPSPLGRDCDGSLVYPAHEDYSWKKIRRIEAAALAKTLVASAGSPPKAGEWNLMKTDWPGGGENLREMLVLLLATAVNPVFYKDTGHGKIEIEKARRAIIGDFHDSSSPDGIVR